MELSKMLLLALFSTVAVAQGKQIPPLTAIRRYRQSISIEASTQCGELRSG